jgi:uncharacterized protein (TIGR03083 family)
MIRDWIAERRRELADVLDGLTVEQWSAPSLCEGWSVANVAAHVTMPFRYSPGRFAVELLRARGRFHLLSNRVAARDAALPRAALAAALRDNAWHPWRPPGAGWEGALAHDIIHGLDITQPLGIADHPPAGALAVVLDGLVSPRSLKHFGVAAGGVALRATDLDWSWGEGRPLAGRANDLALLLAGRRLSGDLFDGDAARLVAGPRR